VIAADYAIVESSEIHFMSVHPLHVEVLDLKHDRLVQVYPFDADPFRTRYSKLIEPHISDEWCEKVNAQCDPENFDVSVEGEVAVNESQNVFGFEARFDAAGFGEEAESHVAPAHVTYVFREHDGVWGHRAFDKAELTRLFHVPNVEALVEQQGQLAFERRPQ
jgi:hypothetical protein